MVELMIALVLGLIVTGGVISIFLSNQQAFRTNENLGRLQENARLSFELMAREMRQAGGNLCGAGTTTNVLKNASTQWSSNWEAGVLQGFDGDQEATDIVARGTDPGERVDGTDAIRVLSGGMFDGVTIVSHDEAASELTLNVVNHGFTTGDIVVVCDGVSAALAKLSAASSGTSSVVAHDAGGGPSDNCSGGLAAPIDCATPNNPANFREYQSGGFVTKMNASTWYVGFNERGGRSLFRINATGTPEEIAEGVSQMQMQYLLKNEATGALGVDWVDASTITDWTPTAGSQVVAVRVKLLLQSVGAVSTNQTPIERQLIHVVNLRNRSL